jgi:alpha-galactosidase
MKNILLILFLGINTLQAQNTTTIFLDNLDVKKYSEGIQSVVTKTNMRGDSMLINRKHYKHGIGVESTSVIPFYIKGQATSFSCIIGADDKANKLIPLTFFILGDSKILYQSPEMIQGDPAISVEVDLKGIQRMGLLVTGRGSGYPKNLGNWANPKITLTKGFVPEKIPNNGNRYILTPPSSPKPRINSPALYGATPGNPVFYTIFASGQKPMEFDASNLPNSLTIDKKTGIITGKIDQRGNYKVTLQAKNALGIAKKTLEIKIGDTISLTPPIGWNGWNSWARLIDQGKVMASAKAMVNKGLKDHGWAYINIDDAWQGSRGGKYNGIQANEKFPSFAAMVDSVHSMGLKVGLYSSAHITTYAGYVGGSSPIPTGILPDSIKNNKRAWRFVGPYKFDENDAKQWADWGIDYLKYDWRIEVPSTIRMQQALLKSGRDIHFSISNSAPFANASDWAKLTNSFRTGPDIRDSWTSLFISAFTLDKWAPFGGHGHWLDPDMMIIGNVTTGSQMHPTRLTPDEQYSHISIFSLLAAPLLIGCPIEQLDDFTLGLLTNDEIIEVNQDPLGISARLVQEKNGVQVWKKPLSDGSFALGFFYTEEFGKTPQSYFHWENEKPIAFTVDLNSLGLTKSYQLRDVWQQKKLGKIKNQISMTIPHHGVKFYKLIPVK